MSREQDIEYIGTFPGRVINAAIKSLLARHGYDVFSDELIAELRDDMEDAECRREATNRHNCATAEQAAGQEQAA